MGPELEPNFFFFFLSGFPRFMILNSCLIVSFGENNFSNRETCRFELAQAGLSGSRIS